MLSPGETIKLKKATAGSWPLLRIVLKSRCQLGGFVLRAAQPASADDLVFMLPQFFLELIPPPAIAGMQRFMPFGLRRCVLCSIKFIDTGVLHAFRNGAGRGALKLDLRSDGAHNL